MLAAATAYFGAVTLRHWIITKNLDSPDEMNYPHRSTDLKHQLNTMSSCAETVPLYQLKSTMVEPVLKATSQLDCLNNLGCPSHCPCICHSLSLSPVCNVERPSVIMAPVVRNVQAANVTHQSVQFEEVISDAEEEHFFQRDMKGKKGRFKLTKRDWELIEVNQFPSGGRLLGGAWTTIFKRGIKESNPWCNVRFKNNHVRAANSRKINSSPFFRGAGECKRRECNMKLKLTIQEERGKYVIVTYTGNVCHTVSASCRYNEEVGRKKRK